LEGEKGKELCNMILVHPGPLKGKEVFWEFQKRIEVRIFSRHPLGRGKAGKNSIGKSD